MIDVFLCQEYSSYLLINYNNIQVMHLRVYVLPKGLVPDELFITVIIIYINIYDTFATAIINE